MRVYVRFQVEEGFVDAHGGPGLGQETALPPLLPGQPHDLTFFLELLQGLPAGRSQIALVTLRTMTVDGCEIIEEIPLFVEAGDRVGAPDSEVVRAHCVHEARGALRRVAEATELDEALAGHVWSVKGGIEARAALAGLERDPAICAAVARLQNTAKAIGQGIRLVAVRKIAGRASVRRAPSVLGSERAPAAYLARKR